MVADKELRGARKVQAPRAAENQKAAGVSRRLHASAVAWCRLRALPQAAAPRANRRARRTLPMSRYFGPLRQGFEGNRGSVRALT